MILDIFKYYAQFPAFKGVQDIFKNGRSDLPIYASLKREIENLSQKSRIPEIDGYVFGQSYDSVKSRIDELRGIYLFLEFGELESERDKRNTIQDTFRLAVTIASKIDSNSDLVEQAIITDQTLWLIHKLRLLQYQDQQTQSWLKEISDKHTLVPFVAKEFSSIGWTMVFNRTGHDMLGLKDSPQL